MTITPTLEEIPTITNLPTVSAPRHYILTVYPDGHVKLTERAATHRGYHGYFVSDRPVKVTRSLGTAVCPVCGTKLILETATLDA